MIQILYDEVRMSSKWKILKKNNYILIPTVQSYQIHCIFTNAQTKKFWVSMLTVLIMNDTETFLASFELMDAVHEYLTSWILLQFTSPKAFFFFWKKSVFSSLLRSADSTSSLTIQNWLEIPMRKKFLDYIHLIL